MNLSARQFSRQGLADHVEALLRRTGVSSRQLGLEMTESSLIPDPGTALEVLSSLRRLGVSLLMDDFGTGYSSLNHLHSLPFDVLKIDRSFVTRMTEGEQPLQIVRTIVELARVMGMDVVAEGIETHEQYMLLRQLGCRFGQGYLFSRPVPAETMSAMLRLPGRILPEPAAAPSCGKLKAARAGRRERADLGIAAGLRPIWNDTAHLVGEFSRRAGGSGCMLQSMQQPAPSQPSPSPSSFCGTAGHACFAARPHLIPTMRRHGTRTTWAKTWPLSATNAPCARMRVTGRQIAIRSRIGARGWIADGGG